MSDTKKLLESIQSNLNESANLDWFNEDGLTIAKGIVEQKGNLNCCEEVSEAVVEAANKSGVTCKILDCGVITKNDLGTSHTVIQIDGGIVDYTQKQFFGSNNPEDCKVDIVKEFEDINGDVNAYTNNSFKTTDGYKINYFNNELIQGLKDNKIVSDTNEYIIYFI